MNALVIRNLVAAIASFAVAGLCLAYVLTDQRRKAKKPAYLVKAMLLIIAGSIYILAAMVQHGDYQIPPFVVYAIRSGWATISILILLLCVIAASVMADWRKAGKNDK